MKIELSVEEINFILNALGQLPYVRVAELIREISKQARNQISEEQNGKEER